MKVMITSQTCSGIDWGKRFAICDYKADLTIFIWVYNTWDPAQRNLRKDIWEYSEQEEIQVITAPSASMCHSTQQPWMRFRRVLTEMLACKRWKTKAKQNRSYKLKEEAKKWCLEWYHVRLGGNSSNQNLFYSFRLFIIIYKREWLFS